MRKTLYVAQSDPENPIWMAFPVKQDKTLEKGKVLFDGKKYMQEFPGLPDGLAVAKDGTIFGSGPGGIYVISPQGKLLGRLITGGRTSNCTFGPDGKTLYITADSFSLSSQAEVALRIDRLSRAAMPNGRSVS